jgi:adenylate cyclase
MAEITTPPPRLAPTAQGIIALLIDDQRIIGEAVRRIVASEPDISFHYLDDPTQAIETALALRPTVILQDLVMPQVDGLSLVSTFREHPATRDIPLIVLSTKEDPSIKAEAFARGANDYLVKLPDRLELLARVRYHSRGYISLLERNDALDKLEVSNRFIRETFGRYLSDDVVDNLLDAPEGLRLGGEKREITIMMSDLRGFTALSEAYSAEQVVMLLNNYLGAMTDIILHYGGAIEEFLGDGILVLFGAPQRREDHAGRAVACALAMQRAMTEINDSNAAQGLPMVEMGIGLNTGEVIVGNIGSQRRTKYGAVGRQVNLTGRIESLTVGGQVLISAATLAAVNAELRIDGESLIDLKGVKGPVCVYEVGGIGAPYDIQLERNVTPLIQLANLMPLTYMLLEDKAAAGERQRGALVRLSNQEAELLSDEMLAPMTNIRLSLECHPEIEIHAKVLQRLSDTPGARVVRFTLLPPAARATLDGLLSG